MYEVAESVRDLSLAGKTLCGHLIDGCLIRSVHEKSHFTIAVMRTEEALINFRLTKEVTSAYPTGVPYHELIQMPVANC